MTTNMQKQEPSAAFGPFGNIIHITLNTPFIKLNRDDAIINVDRNIKNSPDTQTHLQTMKRELTCRLRSSLAATKCEDRLLESSATSTEAIHFPCPAPQTKRREQKLRSRKVLPRRLTRASSRLLQKQKDAAKKSENGSKRCLKVGRTVELVNQSTDSWREKKAKLLYMLSLGLTPILIENTPQNLVVKLSPVDPSFVAHIREKQKAAEKKRMNDEKSRNTNHLQNRIPVLRLTRVDPICEKMKNVSAAKRLEKLTEGKLTRRSLRLTPVPNENQTNKIPVLKVTRIDPSTVEKMENKFEAKRLEKMAEEKVIQSRRSLRLTLNSNQFNQTDKIPAFKLTRIDPSIVEQASEAKRLAKITEVKANRRSLRRQTKVNYN